MSQSIEDEAKGVYFIIQSLLREELLLDLWSRKPVSSNEPDALKFLAMLSYNGYVSGSKDAPLLTDNGLEYVLNRRNLSEMEELLDTIDNQEERTFLANSIRNIVDKPFAYAIIEKSGKNQHMEKYPSVDLGAYDDIEHGLLFGAKTHIMIDPLIDQGILIDIIGKLEDFGAKMAGFDVDGDITKVGYNVGYYSRELYLVKTEAMKTSHNIKEKVENGISALIMKGGGGFRGRDGFGNLSEAAGHYSSFLKVGGLLLTGVAPKKPFEKIGDGMLSYWTHLDQGYRLHSHGLYMK